MRRRLTIVPTKSLAGEGEAALQRLGSKSDNCVIGPNGAPLRLADLPSRNTQRWVIRRKAEVVVAVRGGLLTPEEACLRYSLTVQELDAWQRSVELYGLPGLRTTRIQHYRQADPAPAGPGGGDPGTTGDDARYAGGRGLCAKVHVRSPRPRA